MKLKLHGVRGSRPTHKTGLLGFGGNSTSLELCLPAEDFYLFIDGGSGVVTRGRELGENPDKKSFHFLITHTHWDHILGFPFFEPLYSSHNAFTFYASDTSRSTFNELFFGLHRADKLPVPARELKATVNFRSIKAGDKITINERVQVSTLQLNHQGVTLGYRISSGDDSFAIITDNAPIENGNYLGEGMPAAIGMDPKSRTVFESDFNKALVDFLRGCHTVVFDTHFTEESLKPDWGHSTPHRALGFCKDAGVQRLILFHHAPEDLDSDVADKVQSVIADALRNGVEVVAAREGDEWTLRCE